MSAIAQQPQHSPVASKNGGSGTLYDVLELILDRGLVIDAFVRVSLVGIELLTIDVRVVVASVDTYLRFAEACNRLDLTSSTKSDTLPELVGHMTESGAKGKTKGALGGVTESLTQSFREGAQDQRSQQDQQQDQGEAQPRQRSRSRQSSQRSG